MKNIVFCIDRNYYKHFIVALLSFIKNHHDKNSQYTVHLLHDGLSLGEKEAVRKLLQESRIGFNESIIGEDAFSELVLSNHFTKATYYRLLIQDLPIESGSVLYLDSDLVVNSDISALFEIELGNHYVAAVEDPNFNRHNELYMKPDSDYFNTGVMLVNLPLWRRDNIKAQVVNFVKNHPESIRFVDQCGLNAIIDGRWLPLSLSYNFQSVFLERGTQFRSFSSFDVEKERKNPKIVHFTGSSKPWHLSNSDPYKYLYFKYLRYSGFKSFCWSDITLTEIVKLIIPKSIKRLIRKSASKIG